MNASESNKSSARESTGSSRIDHFSRRQVEPSNQSLFERSFGFLQKVPWEKMSIWTLFLLLLWILEDFFTLIALTFIFSYIANTVVYHLSHRWSLNRRVLTVFMYLAFLGFLVGPGQLLIEQVIQEGRPIAKDARAELIKLFQDEQGRTKRKKDGTSGPSIEKQDVSGSSSQEQSAEQDRERSTDSSPSKERENKQKPLDEEGKKKKGDREQKNATSTEKRPRSAPAGESSKEDRHKSAGEETDELNRSPEILPISEKIERLQHQLDQYKKRLENLSELKDQQRSPLFNEWIQLLQSRQDLIQEKLSNLQSRQQTAREQSKPPEKFMEVEDVPPHIQNIVNNVLHQSLGEEWFRWFQGKELYKNLILEVNDLWQNGVPYVTRWANFVLINAFSFSFTCLLALIFSFLIVFDIPKLKTRLSELEEGRLRDFYQEIAPSLVSFSAVMGRSIQAQAMIAVVNTILTGLGIYFLGLKNFPLLTAIVFVFSFVPVLGVVISSIPIGFVALAQGGLVWLLVAIGMILVIHGIETYILNPQIYGGHMHMHPLLVLIVLLVSEHFFGVWGLILGVPVSVYLLEIVIQQKTTDELFGYAS